MRRRLIRWARRLRARLAGVKLHKALERNRRAAEALDLAVREVLDA